MNTDSKNTDALWYYAENNATLGPVTFAQLEAYLKAGTISLETLVVPQGCEDWTPLSSVMPNLATEMGSQGVARVGVGHGGQMNEGGLESAQMPEHAHSSLREAFKEQLPSPKLKTWLVRAAVAYASITGLFFLARAVGAEGEFFMFIFLGSWAAMTVFLFGKRTSRVLAVGGGFLVGCISPLASMVLLWPFMPGEPRPVVTGITYAQITGNGLGDEFKMERSSDVDGRPRYMGQTDPASAILEVQGDKDDISKASLLLAMPRDSAETIIRNTGRSILFLGNADSTWDSHSRSEWLQTALKQIGQGGAKEVTLERGLIRYSLADVRPLGFSVSLERKFPINQ